MITLLPEGTDPLNVNPLDIVSIQRVGGRVCVFIDGWTQPLIVTNPLDELLDQTLAGQTFALSANVNHQVVPTDIIQVSL